LRQAIFGRRRHQPRRPPLAKISLGSPAPTMGVGDCQEYPPRCGHDLSGEQNSYFRLLLRVAALKRW
jgi:hypothetical protein